MSAYEQLLKWAASAGPEWSVPPAKAGRYRLLYRGGKVFRGSDVRDGMSCFIDCAERADISVLSGLGVISAAGYNEDRRGVGFRFSHAHLHCFLEWCKTTAPARNLAPLRGWSLSHSR